jgi:hypothetical protein
MGAVPVRSEVHPVCVCARARRPPALALPLLFWDRNTNRHSNGHALGQGASKTKEKENKEQKNNPGKKQPTGFPFFFFLGAPCVGCGPSVDIPPHVGCGHPQLAVGSSFTSWFPLMTPLCGVFVLRKTFFAFFL